MSGVYDVRGQFTGAGIIKADFRGRISYDHHGRRLSEEVKSVKRAASVRLSGDVINGDGAGPDKAIIPVNDISEGGEYYSGEDG
jgi:hypothetical protein